MRLFGLEHRPPKKALRQLVEQRPGVLQFLGLEALGEPAVDEAGKICVPSARQSAGSFARAAPCPDILAQRAVDLRWPVLALLLKPGDQILVDLHPEMLEMGRDDELRLFEPLLVADRRGVRVVANRRLDLLVGQLIDPLPVGRPSGDRSRSYLTIGLSFGTAGSPRRVIRTPSWRMV
jgi:hypothetical protein